MSFSSTKQFDEWKKQFKNCNIFLGLNDVPLSLISPEQPSSIWDEYIAGNMLYSKNFNNSNPIFYIIRKNSAIIGYHFKDCRMVFSNDFSEPYLYFRDAIRKAEMLHIIRFGKILKLSVFKVYLVTDDMAECKVIDNIDADNNEIYEVLFEDGDYHFDWFETNADEKESAGDKENEAESANDTYDAAESGKTGAEAESIETGYAAESDETSETVESDETDTAAESDITGETEDSCTVRYDKDIRESIRKAICETAHSTTETENYPFVALYSFMLGMGRNKIYDKFVNYWTAMNSYYVYLLDKYIKNTNGIKPKDNKNDQDGFAMLHAYHFNSFKYIKNLLWKIIKKLYKPIKEGNENSGNIQDKEKKKFKQDFLYRQTMAENIAVIADEYIAKCKEKNIFFSDEQRADLERFISVVSIPYMWRNNFIHGNTTIPIIKDSRFYMLKKMDYIVGKMEEFLMEVIQVMFDGNVEFDDKTKEVFTEYLTNKENNTGNTLENVSN